MRSSRPFETCTIGFALVAMLAAWLPTSTRGLAQANEPIVVPAGVSANEAFETAKAYQEHGLIEPLLPWLLAAIERGSDPAKRGEMALAGLTILQVAGRHEDGPVLLDRAIELELLPRDRAALRLRRIRLQPRSAPADKVEAELSAVIAERDSDSADEARFRLILLWREQDRVEKEAVRLAASTDPDDKLLLATLRWSVQRDRAGAALLYKEWLDLGNWQTAVVDRLEAHYLAVRDDAALESLLHRRWNHAAEAAERRRVAEQLVDLLQKRGELDAALARWAEAAGSGGPDPVDLYVLAHQTGKSDQGRSAKHWEILIRTRPDLPEVIEQLLILRLESRDWKGALDLLANPAAATIPLKERVNMLLAALHRFKLDLADIGGLAERMDADPGNPFLLELSLRIAAGKADRSKVGELSARIVDALGGRAAGSYGDLEPIYYEEAGFWAFGRGEETRGLAYFQHLMGLQAEGSSKVTLALARRSLQAGNRDDFLKWANLTVERAGYESSAPPFYISVAQLLQQAGLADQAAARLRESLDWCISEDEYGAVFEAQARFCLESGRAMESARLAWQALAADPGDEDRAEVLEHLLRRSNDLALSGNGSPAADPAPWFPESVRHNPDRPVLRLFTTAELEQHPKALDLVERIHLAFGERISTRIHDLYRYEDFLHLRKLERNLGFLPEAKSVIVQIGPETGKGEAVLGYLEAVLNGQRALAAAGYLDWRQKQAEEEKAAAPGGAAGGQAPSQASQGAAAALAVVILGIGVLGGFLIGKRRTA